MYRLKLYIIGEWSLLTTTESNCSFNEFLHLKYPNDCIIESWTLRHKSRWNCLEGFSSYEMLWMCYYVWTSWSREGYEAEKASTRIFILKEKNYFLSNFEKMNFPPILSQRWCWQESSVFSLRIWNVTKQKSLRKVKGQVLRQCYIERKFGCCIPLCTQGWLQSWAGFPNFSSNQSWGVRGKPTRSQDPPRTVETQLRGRWRHSVSLIGAGVSMLFNAHSLEISRCKGSGGCSGKF